MSESGPVQRLSTEDKVRLLTGADAWSLPAAPELGLPRIVMSDGPAGVRGQTWDERDLSASLPCPSALAATWDEDLARAYGGLLAAEARRRGVQMVLAPTVNLHRSPLNGRHFECFSEDPLLTARIAAGCVRGLQERGIAATVKHFVCNDSETQRMTYSVEVGERALRELYLAPFEACVTEAGAWAVMAAYNGVGGETMTENRPLLVDVLKREWGFDGVVVSDWFAARSTEATAMGGLDLVMPGPDGPWGERLAEAVREGRVPESEIDDKLDRLLRLAGRVNTGPPEGVGATAATMRLIAAASMVLLQNRAQTLPLDPEPLHRVALIGPFADGLCVQGGGSAHVSPRRRASLLEALTATLPGHVEIVHRRGVRAGRLLAPLSPDRTADPDSGEAGLRLEVLDEGGAVVHSELRATSRFTWIGETPLTLPGAATLRLRGRLSTGVGGRHRFGVAGVGRFRLRAGEAGPVDVEIPLPEDPVEGFLRPPQHVFEIELAETPTVDVTLECVLVPGALPVLVAALGHEPPSPPAEAELEEAVAAAREAEVAIVVVGTGDEIESEAFDRSTLALPWNQDELVRRVAEANANTVVVVNAGAPVLMPWQDRVAAIVQAWFGGEEMDFALADVLLGGAEPGGRMPTTLPRTEADCPVLSTQPDEGVISYDESLLIGYRGYDAGDIEPAFPFGHGLGYTTWSLELVEAADAALLPGRDVRVRVRLHNTGSRAGRTVVQVYASTPGRARPPRALVAFAGVAAEPGEVRDVDLVVPAQALAGWDADAGRWTWERGAYSLLAGFSSRDLPLRTELALD
ncbi:MAG TPA: glycoside hydrolase family 3 C-terminal domain-containing protein [Candidatus Dormibacteraeota bacterium]|jgi:beta-glucosidase|nr:glycoside hydrolase family 3 C-terminal domain-containing protein [Candidatus Dormibacteraeota bacterium]